jgi:hypothetical protein
MAVAATLMRALFALVLAVVMPATVASEQTTPETVFTLIESAEQAPPALSPYAARYTTKAMGLNMTLRRTLKQEDGYYTLRNAGKVLVASLEEEATFTLDGGRIRGDKFTYKLGGIVRRQRAVEFDPEAGTIRSLKKKEWTEHPWSPEVLDRLSQQEQLRLALMVADEPPESLSFQVIDGPRIKLRTLELVGEEPLETEAGELKTLHYRQVEDDDDRSSDIWLAVDHDYLMVRTLHVEKGTDIEIKLVNAEIDGVPINPEGPPII